MEDPKQTSEENTAQTRYSTLESARQTVLDRAREGSKLTLPWLLPPNGHTETSNLPTPFQGVGAEGTNNLSAKLLLTLLGHDAAAFFKFMVNDQASKALDAISKKTRGEVDDGLASLERQLMAEVQTSHIRVPVEEMLKHLIVAGNCLLYFPSEGGMRVFSLDRYVVIRDPMGNALEIIVKESLAPVALPKVIREMLHKEASDTAYDKAGATKAVDLYTCIVREANRWSIRQEVRGKTVPGSEGHYPLDASPWFPLRLIRVDGENYGRGYAEAYLGDLRSLEGLYQSIIEGSAAAAKVLFLVRPNGSTRVKKLATSRSGDFVEGNADDVSTLTLDKFNDFRVTLETIDRIEKRLERAFLMTAAIQRDAERVTAEEIKRMAQDLETALGGVYSLLTQEFQLPLVNLLIKRLQRQGKFPVLPPEVKISVIAGLDALGRGNDLANLTGFLTDLAPFMQQIGPEIDMREIARRFAAARGIPLKGLLKDQEAVAQQTKDASNQQLLHNIAPDAVKAILPKLMEGGAQPQEAPQGGITQAQPAG